VEPGDPGAGAIVPSPLYSGERARVRGLFVLFLILFFIREEEED
jgi:hypothetical protein